MLRLIAQSPRKPNPSIAIVVGSGTAVGPSTSAKKALPLLLGIDRSATVALVTVKPSDVITGVAAPLHSREFKHSTQAVKSSPSLETGFRLVRPMIPPFGWLGVEKEGQC